MTVTPDPERPSPPTSARARSAAWITVKLVLLVLGVVYTLLQAAWLVFPFVQALFPRNPGSNHPGAYRVGVWLGAIAGFWLGAIFCVVLFRSFFPNDNPGPRRRGFAFASLFLLTVVLLLGGGVAILVGWSGVFPYPTDLALRAGGILLLGTAVAAMMAAFGRSRRSRVKALLVEEDADGDEQTRGGAGG